MIATVSRNPNSIAHIFSDAIITSPTSTRHYLYLDASICSLLNSSDQVPIIQLILTTLPILIRFLPPIAQQTGCCLYLTPAFQNRIPKLEVNAISTHPFPWFTLLSQLQHPLHVM